MQLGSQLVSIRIPAASYQKALYIYILAITPAHHGTSTWYEGSFLYTASSHRRDSLKLISRIVMHAVRCCSSQLNAWSGKPNGNKIIHKSPNHLWKLQSWGFPTRFGMFKPGISGLPDPNPQVIDTWSCRISRKGWCRLRRQGHWWRYSRALAHQGIQNLPGKSAWRV